MRSRPGARGMMSLTLELAQKLEVNFRFTTTNGIALTKANVERSLAYDSFNLARESVGLWVLESIRPMAGGHGANFGRRHQLAGRKGPHRIVRLCHCRADHPDAEPPEAGGGGAPLRSRFRGAINCQPHLGWQGDPHLVQGQGIFPPGLNRAGPVPGPFCPGPDLRGWLFLRCSCGDTWELFLPHLDRR